METAWKSKRKIELQRISPLIATLNTLEIGDLETIRSRLTSVRSVLVERDLMDLVQQVDECLAALERGDLMEFQRLKASVTSRLGHFRN